MSYVTPLTPLQEELLVLDTLSKQNAVFSGTSATASSTYKEYVGPIMKLLLTNIGKQLPDGKYCVAGGVFRSVFYGEVPEDLDVFLLGNETEIEASINDLATLVGVAPIKVKVQYPNEYIKHIRIITVDVGRPYKIQFIGQWFQSPFKASYFLHADDVLQTFDMISCCFGIDFKMSTVNSTLPLSSRKEYEILQIVSHPLLLKTVATKELAVNDLGDMTLKKMKAERFYKYIAKYGFRIKKAAELKNFNFLLKGGDTDVESDYE